MCVTNNTGIYLLTKVLIITVVDKSNCGTYYADEMFSYTRIYSGI